MKLTVTALVFAAAIFGMALGAKWFVWQECRATVTRGCTVCM